MANAHWAPAPEPHEDISWFRQMLTGIFVVEDVTYGAMNGNATRLRGQLLIDADAAYERLAPAVAERGNTLLMRREEDQVALYIAHGRVQPTPNNPWLPWVLGFLTVLSVFFVGILHSNPPDLSLRSMASVAGSAAAYTAALLGILLSHEMGHYIVARRLGLPVTLPYLIPMPIPPLGTMGAVIRMKDMPPSRRAELYTGAAGPIAGVIVAIPVLILGLSLSTVGPLPTSGGYYMEGNSVLYLLLKLVMFGKILPGNGLDVLLHPVAFAGWAGLLVTSLNLLPAGQLDGGHVAHALLGARARYLTWAVMGILLILGIFWLGWFLWVGLIYLFARVQPMPYNDVSRLTSREKVLAVVALVVFVLAFTPVPLQIIMS